MEKLLLRLRRHRHAQRLRYEIIYSWPGWLECSTFNVGYWPPDASIASDRAFAAEPNQIQLYAELMRTARLKPEALYRAAVLEIAAGRGGGLSYIRKVFAPGRLVGLDISGSAVRHAKRRGLDMLRGAAHRLPFPEASFDLVLSLDALIHLGDRERIAREAARVLKPDGTYMVGDFILQPIEEARQTVDQLAKSAGLYVQIFRDVTPGVVASLERDHDRKAALVARLPRFVRHGLAETMTLRGTTRFREWQTGKRSYFVAALVPLQRPRSAA